MPEQLHGQIDTKQQEIETLRGPAEAKKKIREYRATYVNAVDSGQRELKVAAGTLKSPEAQAFLTKASSEISGHLTSMASRGRDIIKAHEDAKKGEKPVNVPSLDDLSGKLRSRLSGLKSSIDSFKLIEEVKEEEEKIAKENDKLNDSDGSVAPTKIYKAKKELMEKMTRLEPKIKVTADSRSYWEGVQKAHLALHKKISDEAVALAVPMVDEGTINDFKAHVEAYVKLAEQYQKSPSDTLKQQLLGAAAKIHSEKVESDVFTESTSGSENYEQKFYSHLWNTYSTAKDSFEKAQSSLESKEKEELTAEAKVAAGAYEKAWETSIRLDFDKYVALKPDEQNASDLEKNLLSKLLQSKQLLSKYSSPDVQEKLDYGTSELITKHLEEIGWNIKKIEGLRSEFLNEKDFKKDDLSKYVSFPTRDGYRTVNETYYDFTPAFSKLSEAEQIRVKQLIERIAAKNLDSVKKETAKEQLKFLNPEEKMKQLKEMMGEKGKLYWSAYEKMKGNDPESSLSDFQAYADQSFSTEEMAVHGEMIADAQEKVKGFYTGRILTIEGLLRDVKEMKYAHAKLVGRPEIKPDEATEANEIEKELTLFKDEISKGEVKDFKARYEQMTKKVRNVLAQKKIEETGVLKWMNHLHEATREKDPEKRKKAFIAFAKEAREYQGYNLAKKYLDYAISEEAEKYAKDVTRDSVLKDMLAEKDFVYKLEQNTKAQYDSMMKNDPSLAKNLTMKDVRDLLIERALKGRYSLAVRRKMTLGVGMDKIDGDSALGIYNNWFPLDEPDWYKPWDYGAQQWDEFQMECAKLVFETVATFGIGAGASTMGRIGAKQGGKFALKYFMREGLKQAEIEIIERGGLLALRKAAMKGGEQAGEKWLTRKTLSFAASRLVSGVTLEAATMTSLGTTQQFLQAGPKMFEEKPGDFLAKEFLRSMAFSTIFRGLGVVQHNIKPLANALEGGGAMGKAAFLGAETVSGGAGVVIEYAFAKAQGHEFTGKDAFKSMISNYAMAVGMGAIHRPPGGGRNTITENYRKRVASDFQKSTGVDFKNPSTIKTARVSPEGHLIVNGKAMKDFDMQVLAHLPKKARERILDLAPDNALDTHYKSNFTRNVPKELLPDGDSARANEVHGWIGTDGKIHYNLSHLNTGHSESGPYRGKKILPEGHTIKVNKSGDMVIEGTGGKEMSFHQFLKTPEGKNSPLLAEMKRIKHHEATHQVLESLYTKMSNGERVVDPSKTKSLTDMFARPDLDGRLPEGKIPLVDHTGKPMDVTWQNVQEYLCHVGDGSIKASPEMKHHFERVVARQVPGFSFSRVRQLSTKALASQPADAFSRTHTAADHVGEPWKKIEDLDDLAAAVKKDKVDGSNYKIAETLMIDFMSVLRSGDKAQIEYFKQTNSSFIEPKVLTQFESQYKKSVSRLGEHLSTPEGIKTLALLESGGKLNAFDRVILKRLGHETKLVTELTSKKHSDGTLKTREEITADMKRLKENIDFGAVELSPLILQHLSTTAEGIALIRYGLRHGRLENFASLPEPVKQKLVDEAHGRTQYRVKKGMEKLQERIAKAKADIEMKRNKGKDTEIPETKLANLEGRLEAYKRLGLMDKATFAEAVSKLDARKHPPGFEDMPKLTEVLMANADKMNVDYVAAIMEGKMKYKEMGIVAGRKKVMFLEGPLLGVGGLGEVWATITFNTGSLTPHEMVMKRSKVAKHVDIAMSNYDILDRDVRYDINQVVDMFTRSGIKIEGGLNLALNKAKDIGLNDHDYKELNNFLSRLQAAHNEAQNVRLIMDHQAKGELTAFTQFHYVTDDNVIFMESIAVPKANYQVCDYEAIMKGDVTSLDGKAPISKEIFWGNLADIMDSIGDAHALGFVHRDIKPENFGIGPDGKVRLIDAGSIKTKGSMGKVDYLELSYDPYDLPHQADRRTTFYYPYEGGITLDYYDGSISYHESKGTIASDGKPKVNFGGSDRISMALSLKKILHTQAKTGKPKWTSPEQVGKIQGIIEYLKKPRSDITVAAERLREAMEVH